MNNNEQEQASNNLFECVKRETAHTCRNTFALNMQYFKILRSQGIDIMLPSLSYRGLTGKKI